MIAELENLLPGSLRVNHTRCFLHINNLVAQTLVWQFDIPKAKPGAATDDDDPNNELRELAGDINLEERQTWEALLEQVGQWWRRNWAWRQQQGMDWWNGSTLASWTWGFNK
jgi:hypothetical protein